MITGTAERLTPLPLSPSSFSEPSLITLSAESSISPHKPIVHPKKERLKTNDDAASILSNSGPISTEKTRDSVAVASVVPAEEPSPLVADLNENDFAFDPEAQSHLNKNEEALVNRIKANPKNGKGEDKDTHKNKNKNKEKNNLSRPLFPGMTEQSAILNPFSLIYNEASILNDYPNDSTRNTDKSLFSDSLSNRQSSGSFDVSFFFRLIVLFIFFLYSFSRWFWFTCHYCHYC
jgi:hypothetical protein